MTSLHWLSRPRRALAVLGLLASLGVAVLGPVFARDSGMRVVDEPYGPLSAGLPLGTDHYGFDVLSRLLHGGGRIVAVSMVVVAIAYLLGTAAGVIAQLRGGWLDALIMRTVDVLMGLPALVLLTVVITGAGRGIVGVALGTAIVLLPDLVRTVRAATGEVLSHDFVEAAVARGESTLSVLVREVLPNLVHVLVADVSIRWVAAAYTVATAGFLGFGVQPPAADWGLMVYENRDGLGLQPLAVLAPAAALLVLLLSATTLLDDLATERDLAPTVPRRRQSPSAGPVDRVLAGPGSDVVGSLRDLTVLSLPAGRTILDKVSVAVRRGEVVALFGESGSGKTTTALAMLGHVRPGLRQAGGSAWLGGQELAGLSERSLRRMRSAHAAYVAQDPRTALAAHIRVGDQIGEVIRARGVPKAERAGRIRDALRAVGLPEHRSFQRRWPHELSGGQRQRVALAAALAHRPDLLVLDEPTSAVDPATSSALISDIDRLRREHGLAVLLVSHDAQAVARIADRVVVLKAGTVAGEGPPHAVLPPPIDLAQAAERAAATPEHDGQKPSLRVRDLRFGQPSQGGRVLHDVSFDVHGGTSLSVLGESGSGKTTLLRCLAGLLEPSAGTVALAGNELARAVRKRAPGERRRIALVPQNPYDSLNPRHTVAQIVGRPLRQFGLAGRAELRERVTSILALVGLPAELLDRRPSALSGGQRQRVALARALAIGPDVLLCDEVTSALDPGVGAEITSLLGRLRDQLGIALVVVTHDPLLAARLSGVVLVLRAGRVVETGPAQRVLTSPADAYTSRMLSPQRLL